MKILLLPLLTVMLTGCSGPRSVTTIREIVPVPCQVKIPDRPVFAGDVLTGEEDLWEIGVALWADRKERQAYELRIETLLAGCTSPIVG